MKQLIFLLVLYIQLNGILAGNILFLYPIATRSETNVFLPIAKSLAAKGHTVTTVTPLYTENLNNVKQVVPVKPLQDLDFMLNPTILEDRILSQNKIKYLLSLDSSAMEARCHRTYQNEEFKNILNSGKFDLIFMSGFFNECFEALVYKFQVPYIMMTSMPVPHWVAAKSGFRMPPSFVPVPLLDFSSQMNFWERFTNTVLVWLFAALSDTVMYTESENIYRKYLGDDMPGIKEIEKNLSVILSNSHSSINFARPTLPNIIEVGGIHCRPAQPLPQDLDTFISEAKHGVIYVSMGSTIQPNTLPEQLGKAFLEVFGKRKERILWKWDSDKMESLPPNVKISKWLPQQDILGHPNVKLFVTQSGQLSTQEAVYHGVPILAIPILVDQDINARVVENAGFGLREEILEVTAESMGFKIERILSDPSFANQAKKLSKIYKDQLETPLDRAVYWVEYCLRHNGAHHLKSPARDLNVIQYHSLDVMGLILVLVCALFGTLYGILYCLCCRGSRGNKEYRKTKSN